MKNLALCVTASNIKVLHLSPQMTYPYSFSFCLCFKNNPISAK